MEPSLSVTNKHTNTQALYFSTDHSVPVHTSAAQYVLADSNRLNV